MKVTLPAELARYVEEQVAGGRFATADAVVEEGLRLLRRRQERDRRKLEDLRREIQIGIDQAERGEVAALDETLIEEIKRRGRERLAAQQGRSPHDRAHHHGPSSSRPG